MIGRSLLDLSGKIHEVNMSDDKPIVKDESCVEYIPLKTFLEEYPIGTFQKISGYYEEDSSANNYYRFPRCAPTLRLYCDECDGIRNFDGTWVHDKYITKEMSFDDFLIYTCRDCNKYKKHFCLGAHHLDDKGNGEVIKIGEYPELYIAIPSNLPGLFGEDYPYFIKGLKCEKRGLGIGAYSYYRRLVENQKNRLLSEILKVSKKLSAKTVIIQTIEKAISETQFSKAIDMVKETIPEALLVDGHNPFKLLHTALSIGIHDQPDDKCLEIAHNIRMVLVDLADRIKLALNEKSELHSAVSSLLKFNEQNNK